MQKFLQAIIFIEFQIYQKIIYDLFIGMYKKSYRTFNEYKQLLSDALTVRYDIY